MLLLTTATAKALDQRNVVVYDALSDGYEDTPFRNGLGETT